MMRRKLVFAFCWAVANLGSFALAHPASTTITDREAAQGNSPVGVGALVGTQESGQDYRILVEGQNHFRQRRGIYNLRQYGHGQSRLELGNGLGLQLAATSGITLYGLDERGGVSAHFGVEPMSGRIAVDTSGRRANFYEWLPAAATGVQMEIGSCRLLPLIRGGVGLGNLSRPNWLPGVAWTYGAGTYLNCARFDFAAEVTRLSGNQLRANLFLTDIAYTISPRGIKIGLRGEQNLFGSSAVVSGATERRVMLILRSQLSDLLP